MVATSLNKYIKDLLIKEHSTNVQMEDEPKEYTTHLYFICQRYKKKQNETIDTDPMDKINSRTARRTYVLATSREILKLFTRTGFPSRIDRLPKMHVLNQHRTPH